MTLDNFETQLLTELRREVAERSTNPVRRPWRRRAAASLAGVAAVAAAATAGLMLRPDPAFSVEPQADGSVVVTISSIDAADELEAALADEGVEADVEIIDIQPEVTGPDGSPEGGTLDSESGVGREPSLSELPGEIPDDCLVNIKSERDGAVTFTLPASIVDAEEILHIGLGSRDDMVVVSFDDLPGPC